jgi:hypothetical protein
MHALNMLTSHRRRVVLESTSLTLHNTHVQAVTKEALTEDHQLAYWHLRYSIRTATAGTAGTGVEPEVPHTRQQHQQQLGGASGLELDVPVFLLSHATLILTTGE